MKHDDFEPLSNDNKILIRENQELKQQITKLKSQFDAALKINDQLEESFKKNSELSKKLNQCESEKTELIKRLDIANKNIIDMEQKIRNIPTITSTEIRYETDDTKIQKLQEKIEKLEEDILKKQQIIQKSIENRQELEGEMNKVYKAVTQSFGQNVKSADDLLPIFTKCKQLQTNPTAEIEITKYKAKADKWKEKYEYEKEMREKLEMTPPQLPQVSHAQIFSQKEEYNKIINQLKQSNETLNKNYNAVKEENEKILTENSQLSTQIRILNLQLDDTQNTENAKHSEKLATISAELLSLKDENGKLKCHLHELNRRNKALTGEINEMRSSHIETEKLTCNIKNKLEESEDNNEKLKHQLKNTQKKLKVASKESKDAKEEKMKIEKVLQTTETDLQRFKASSDAFESSLIEARAELEQQQQIVAKLKLELDEKTTESARHEKTANSLREQLENASRPKNQPLIQNRPIEIPPSAFFIKDTPEKLSNTIKAIIQQQIPTSAKITQCLSATSDFYRKQISKESKKIEEEKKQREKIEEDLKFSAEFIQRKIGIDLDLSNLRDDRIRDSFNEFVIAEKQKMTDLQSKLNKSEKKVAELMEVFNTNSPEDLKKQISKLQKTNSKQKRIINELKSIITQQEEESKNTLKAIEEEFNRVAQTCTQQESAINQSKEEIEKLKREIEERMKEKESLENDIQSLQNEIIKNKESYENTINELNNASKDLEERIEALISTKTNLEEERNELLKDLNEAKIEIEKLKKEVEERNAEADELATHVRKISKEKKRLIKKHKNDLKECESKIMEQLKQSTNEASKLIKELRESLEQSETENTKLRSEVEEKNLQIKKLEMTSSAAAKDSSRELQQMEAKWLTRNKALETSLEMEHQKINKLMNALSIIQPLLATGEKLSEDGIEVALSNLRARFDLLIGRENRIRGMLKIGPNQSIEDSIFRKIN